MSRKASDPGSAIATASQTVGPFFHFGLARDEALGRVALPDSGGEPMALRVRVLDGDGEPLPDALIEVYHADADGEYGQRTRDGGVSGFGRLPTNEEGVCVFDTIRPGAVPDGRGGVQAPHVNVCLFARGLLRHVYTRIYFQGDAGLATDALLALVPPDRRETLMATPAEGDERRTPNAEIWDFVIRLQGDSETVFFDL